MKTVENWKAESDIMFTTGLTTPLQTVFRIEPKFSLGMLAFRLVYRYVLFLLPPL